MSTLTEKEETGLRLYMQRLEELLKSPIVKNQKESIGVLSETGFGDKHEMDILFDGYDNDTFRAFYATFRQFSMPKEEAVYFKDTCQLIKDKCARPELINWVNAAEVRWDYVLASHPAVRFELQGKSYTNAELLKLWLYGGRFHTDIKKAELWNALGPLAQSDAEISIQGIVPQLLNCLVIVGRVIRWWLDAPSEVVPPVTKAKKSK